MPLVNAKCTNCGATMQVDNTKDAIICEFCGSAFIVEKAINNYNTTNNISAQTVNIYGGNSADFVITAGKLIKYNGVSVEVEIPDTVSIIGESAFFGCEGLTSVTIPNSVKTIGESAFSGCKGLTSVTIPNSVKTIGKSAFSGCEGLTSVTIPNSVKTIEDYAFHSCTGLTSVTLMDGITEICSGTFEGCTGITSITIPNSVKTIGYSAFSGCGGLTSVTIMEGVTKIEGSAFYNCTVLKSITIPNSIKSIAAGAFYGCPSSMKVHISDIASWCNIQFYEKDSNPLGNLFLNGKLVVDLIIPDSVTEINKNVFSGFSELASVTLPNSVKYIGESAFSGCSSLTSITFPNSVTEIGYGAFTLCQGLKTVTISNGATTIQADTFSQCHITKVIAKRNWKKKYYYNFDCLKSYGPKGCYIATCVYGSYDCPSVWTLRRFRDDVLDNNIFGRAFIRCYYAISPTIVRLFGKTKWFRKFWKNNLDKLVNYLNKNGIENTKYSDKY